MREGKSTSGIIKEQRGLTVLQQEKLDQLAEDHPECKVIDWMIDGPIIVYRGGRRYLTPGGELIGG